MVSNMDHHYINLLSICSDHYLLVIVFLDISSRIRTLERASRSLKSEKNQLADEVASLKATLASKEKELKESHKSYREAQDEISQVTDK